MIAKEYREKYLIEHISHGDQLEDWNIYVDRLLNKRDTPPSDIEFPQW